MRDITGVARTFSYEPLHREVLVLTDQQELINNSTVRTPDEVRKTWRERWNMTWWLCLALSETQILHLGFELESSSSFLQWLLLFQSNLSELWMYVYVCVCIDVHACVCLLVCVYACVRVCVCVCVCMFHIKKIRSRRYPTETMTDADYADDLALFANTPALVELLVHSLGHAAVGIGLFVNAN